MNTRESGGKVDAVTTSPNKYPSLPLEISTIGECGVAAPLSIVKRRKVDRDFGERAIAGFDPRLSQTMNGGNDE